MSSRYQRARGGNPHPDPGHGCADPTHCTNPYCARPVDIHLVRPQQARVVVRHLPGWPQSASALLDWIRERLTRNHLLSIANSDPFGAHEHFPTLVEIWMSGRVPALLTFDPGEALRLYRWSCGPDIDHVSRALCCTLLSISSDEDDFFDDVAAPLVDSCLAIGGDAPALAEQLLAWRAVSEPPNRAKPGEDHGCPDPVALLALVLLRIAADPDDARLPDLARTVADAFTPPGGPPWHVRDRVPEVMAGGHARTWQHLVTTVLAPWRPTRPDINRLVTALPMHSTNALTE
jgi:hypothetical protein